MPIADPIFPSGRAKFFQPPNTHSALSDAGKASASRTLCAASSACVDFPRHFLIGSFCCVFAIRLDRSGSRVPFSLGQLSRRSAARRPGNRCGNRVRRSRGGTRRRPCPAVAVPDGAGLDPRECHEWMGKLERTSEHCAVTRRQREQPFYCPVNRGFVRSRSRTVDGVIPLFSRVPSLS